jgi:serine/threonine protein kinase
VFTRHMNEPDASKYGDNIDTLVVHDRIGKGSYGEVYRSVLKPSVRERAVEIAVAAKVMPVESTDAAIVLREVTLQQEAGSHPSIVAMVGCFHNEGSAAG